MVRSATLIGTWVQSAFVSICFNLKSTVPSTTSGFPLVPVNAEAADSWPAVAWSTVEGIGGLLHVERNKEGGDVAGSSGRVSNAVTVAPAGSVPSPAG